MKKLRIKEVSNSLRPQNQQQWFKPKTDFKDGDQHWF